MAAKRKAAEGRAVDMEEIFQEQYPVVRQFALSLTRGRAANVEDVVQMAFLALFKVLDSGREVKNVRPFLFSAVRRAFVDFERRASHVGGLSPEWIHDAEESPPEPRSLEEGVLVKLQADYLLGSLPPADAETVVLVATGLSTQEIAERLGISAATVRRRLIRARQQLREQTWQSLDELEPRRPTRKAAHPAPPLDAYELIFGLDRVVERLRQTYVDTAAREWLVRPHPLLDNERPIDLLRAGETRRVQGLIDAVAEGVFV